MQKVITIRSSFAPDYEKDFSEDEYTKLNQLFNDGFKIIDKIIVASNSSNNFSIVFILDNFE